MSDKTPLADLHLPDDKIAALRLVYCLIGKFDYGWKFDVTLIPAAHIASLMPRFDLFLQECSATPEQLQEYRDLYAELTGSALPLVEYKPARVEKAAGGFRKGETVVVADPRAAKTRVASKSDDLFDGNIDYGAAVNDMTKASA